jgi:uncharacterized protein (TIGR02118 family)
MTAPQTVDREVQDIGRAITLSATPPDSSREVLQVYKVVWFARFLEGTDKHEARRRWREIHGPLGLKVPQIEAYVQSHAVAALGPDKESSVPLGFDGYANCWFADEESYREALQTPGWSDIAAGSANLFEPGSFRGMCAVLDERTIVDGDYGPFKAVWVVRFKDEIRSDPARIREAHEHWIETHGGRFGRDVPGIGRYVQNHCVAPLGEQGADPSGELLFDGYSECWFEHRGAFELATSSPEWLAMNDDAVTFCDVGYILGGMSAVVEENVVKGGRTLTGRA